jgi:hypothetical protein
VPHNSRHQWRNILFSFCRSMRSLPDLVAKRHIIAAIMSNPIFPEMEFHLAVVCNGCQVYVPLPTGKIRWLFFDPKNWPNDIHAVALACPRCSLVDRYTLHKKFPGYNPKNQAVPMRPWADVVFAEPLQCVVETCKSRLPLIAAWKPTTTAAERRANIETWNWENLTCPKGHRIERPELLRWSR